MKIDFSVFVGIGSWFEAKKKQFQAMWGVRHVIAKWKVFMLYHDCFFKHIGAFMEEIRGYKEVSSYANFISAHKPKLTNFRELSAHPEVIDIRQKASSATKKAENPSAAFFEKNE
jgi:hypothetical protein